MRYLILGASKAGIGQATTLAAIAAGGSVVGVFSNVDDEGVQFRKENSTIDWVEADTSDSQAYLETLQRIDGINAVIHADFYFYMENSDTFALMNWERSLRENLTAPKALGFCAMNAWQPSCKSVVFVTSSEANTGSFGAHACAATKAAVHNLAKSLANTAGGTCRFNCIAAGWIGGVMDTDDVFNMSREITPLGRLGAPEEGAAAALWLTSEGSSFVNGATLFTDGGYTGVDTISKFEFQSEFGQD